MRDEFQVQTLAEFLSDPIELVRLSTASELVSQITDRFDALGIGTKVRTEPHKPLTRVYILEDNGNMRAQGRGRTRVDAFVEAVLQFVAKEQERAA
jgi:hypothetical protein